MLSITSLKSVYFLGLLAELLVRFPHERQRRQNRIVVDRVSWLERLLVGLVAVGLFCIPVVYAFTPWLNRANYRLSPRATSDAGGVGAAFLGIAVWLFWRSHTDLGREWSPSLQIREGHTLITSGVYKSIRHPMYASIWLWGIAQALLLQNWVAGFASLVLFLPMYVLRVPREEQMMLEQFGEAYRAYINRTGRVIPRLGG
jgi:protein-S-isoprenylcysteine O-methyltransferase Ste14